MAQVRHVDTCTICLEPVSDRAIISGCNHYTFDFMCLLMWTREHPEHPKCPLCKGEIVKIDYDFGGPQDFKTYDIDKSSMWDPVENVEEQPPVRQPVRRRKRKRSDAELWAAWIERNAPVPRALEVETRAVERRRKIYKNGLYSCHIGINRYSGFRDITPADIANCPRLQYKARKWVRRELLAFPFLKANGMHVEGRHVQSGLEMRIMDPRKSQFLLEYIVAILRTTDLKDSEGKAENMLAEFLGRANARLFCHELGSWMRSPYAFLAEWDDFVQYTVRTPFLSDDNLTDVDDDERL